MGPDLHTPDAPLRCRACGAALRAGAPWCTQCYAPTATADPGPQPVPGPAPDPALAPEPDHDPAHDPGPRPASRLTVTADGDAAWPCLACGAANPLAATSCTACGAGFLAALAEADRPRLVLPGVGDLGALGRGQRLGLAAGVVVSVVLLTLLLGLLLS